MRVTSVVAVSITWLSLSGCVVAAYPDHRPHHHYPTPIIKPYCPPVGVVYSYPASPRFHHGHHHHNHRHHGHHRGHH